MPTQTKQFVILVTARSGDQYAIGPFDSEHAASRVGNKLTLAAHWKIIRLVRDYM